MSNPMPPLMKGKTRGNPSNPSDPSGFNETDDLFCEKTDDSASLGVTVDPLAKVPWPSVREYLVQGNTQRIADFCRSLWRVEYDDVLVGAYQRWPELAPEVVEQPE